MKVLVEVSARHIHLSKDVLEKIFGRCYNLNIKKNLSQPGQFACEERVEIEGPKGSLKNVSVLGPLRAKTQAEISITDAIKIGAEQCVRESGDLNSTAGFTLIGPYGKCELNEGLIVAKRHIHMSPEDAKTCGVKNSQNVWIKIKNNVRSAIFGDVVVRVNPNFKTALHIDTDEANAIGYSGLTFGEILTKSI